MSFAIPEEIKEGLKKGATDAVKAAADLVQTTLLQIAEGQAVVLPIEQTLDGAIARQELVKLLWENRDKLDAERKKKINDLLQIGLSVGETILNKAGEIAIQTVLKAVQGAF